MFSVLNLSINEMEQNEEPASPSIIPSSQQTMEYQISQVQPPPPIAQIPCSSPTAQTQQSSQSPPQSQDPLPATRQRSQYNLHQHTTGE